MDPLGLRILLRCCPSSRRPAPRREFLNCAFSCRGTRSRKARLARVVDARIPAHDSTGTSGYLLGNEMKINRVRMRIPLLIGLTTLACASTAFAAGFRAVTLDVPIVFEENRGQGPSEVQFTEMGGGG